MSLADRSRRVMVQSNHRRWLESSDVIQVVVKVRDGTLRMFPFYLEHSVERLSKPLW